MFKIIIFTVFIGLVYSQCPDCLATIFTGPCPVGVCPPSSTNKTGTCCPYSSKKQCDCNSTDLCINEYCTYTNGSTVFYNTTYCQNCYNITEFNTLRCPGQEFDEKKALFNCFGDIFCVHHHAWLSLCFSGECAIITQEMLNCNNNTLKNCTDFNFIIPHECPTNYSLVCDIGSQMDICVPDEDLFSLCILDEILMHSCPTFNINCTEDEYIKSICDEGFVLALCDFNGTNVTTCIVENLSIEICELGICIPTIFENCTFTNDGCDEGFDIGCCNDTGIPKTECRPSINMDFLCTNGVCVPGRCEQNCTEVIFIQNDCPINKSIACCNFNFTEILTTCILTNETNNLCENDICIPGLCEIVEPLVTQDNTLLIILIIFAVIAGLILLLWLYIRISQQTEFETIE